MSEVNWIDSIGGLYDWLGSLIAGNPSIRECTVFAIDGDGLRTEHFHWHDEDGGSVDIDAATEVSISTDELPDETDLTVSHAALVKAAEAFTRWFESEVTSAADLHEVYDKAKAALLLAKGDAALERGEWDT